MQEDKDRIKETIGQDDVGVLKIEEGMQMNAALDELEKKMDDVNQPITKDKDQESPPRTPGQKIDWEIDNRRLPPHDILKHPPLSKEDKINIMNILFPISLGDYVKNKHDEKGYVESVCIDHRGIIYLVSYQKHELIWESEYQIEKIVQPEATEGVSHRKTEGKSIKTDIPDPKTHTVGDRKSEIE